MSERKATKAEAAFLRAAGFTSDGGAFRLWDNTKPSDVDMTTSQALVIARAERLAERRRIMADAYTRTQAAMVAAPPKDVAPEQLLQAIGASGRRLAGGTPPKDVAPEQILQVLDLAAGNAARRAAKFFDEHIYPDCPTEKALKK